MSPRRVLVCGAVAVAAFATVPWPALASAPASSAVTVPAVGHRTSVAWTGSVQPGADVSTCLAGAPVNDSHALTVTVPPRLYSAAKDVAHLSVTWHDTNDNLNVAVLDPKGNDIADATGPSTSAQSLNLTDLPAGNYTVIVCPGQDLTPVTYSATMTFTTTARPPAAASTGVNDATMTFTSATVVDPVLFGGEPGFTFDPTTDGSRSFVDWPVSSRTMIGVLFRSQNGGLSYTKRYSDGADAAAGGPACVSRQTPYCLSGGGGDTNMNINPTSGAVQFGNQESLANQAVGISLDHGTTFPADHVDPLLDKTGTGVDRQWSATLSGTKIHFMAYHVPLLGEFVNSSNNDGAAGSWTVSPAPAFAGVTQSGSMIADNSATSPHRHALYIGFIGDGLPGGAPAGFDVAVSTDAEAKAAAGSAPTWTVHQVPGGGSPRSFTTLATDTAGNLYATWVDSSTQRTNLAVASATAPANRTAPGSAWSKPVVISQAPLTVTIFPNVVAGSPGRLAVGYYGTTAPASTPDAVLPGQGGWRPYVGYTDNATCLIAPSPCAKPAFHQIAISHQPNHDTNICTSGTACAANPGSNRNLLDYFAVSLDKQGHLGFVWSDSTNSTLEPFVKVSRQASGPSLYAGQPDAQLPQRGNGYPNAPGQALYPIAGASVLTAHNHPQLDLLGTSVALRRGNVLEVSTRIASTGTGLSGALASLGAKVDADGTPLQQVRYVTRWDFGGHSYYVEATTTGAEQPTFGAGEVGTGELIFNGGAGTAPAGNDYAPLAKASGTVRNGRLVIDVPVGAVGSPRPGSRLVSVGSYALAGPQDSLATLQTAPITVDSTPTFDTALQSATAAPATSNAAFTAPSRPGSAGPGSGPGVATGNLPRTGLAGVLPLTALLLVMAAAALRRRHLRV